jgi:hypothetical protein
MTEVCNKRVVVVRDCNDEFDVVLNRMVESGKVYTAVRYRCQGIKPLVITEYYLIEVRRWVSEESVMDLWRWREMRIGLFI